jgi:hypothetical protein
VVRVLVVCAVAWLCWEIVSNTAADRYAVERPATALLWVGSHPAALAAASEQQIVSQSSEFDADAAFDMAGRALQADPLEADALRAMALAAEADGDLARADILMRMAGSRSRRDLAVQVWLANRRLAAEDHSAALGHIDASLRVWGEKSDAFIPVLANLAHNPDVRDMLAGVLREDPPWRRTLLTRLPKDSPDPRSLYGFYSGLMSGQAPLRPEELRPYLQSLINEGHAPLAYVLQVEFLSAEQVGALDYLNNGGFDLPLSGLPFDWTIDGVNGARAAIVVDDNANKVLRVEFHDTRVAFRHVSQLLLLQPGSYQLTGAARSVELLNDRGMQWIIACADGEQIAATDRISGTRPWTPFSLTFEVPNRSGCAVQSLRLVLAARIPAEQRVRGEIWYDNLRIARDEISRQPRADRE